MTREDFINEHLNELVGLLLQAFERSQQVTTDPKTHEIAGRAMIAQMRAARDLLGRAYDRLTQPAQTLPVKPGQNQTRRTG